VQLVDEEQDTPFRAGDLVEDRLQALLELAAVLGSGQERPHVEGEDRPVPKALRHVPVDDALGEPLDNRRLADTGVANEHGVVLCLPRQDLHDAPDLRVAPDDRVELAGPGLLHQVTAVLLERLVGDLGHR
jgi:hypothetical protein